MVYSVLGDKVFFFFKLKDKKENAPLLGSDEADGDTIIQGKVSFLGEHAWFQSKQTRRRESPQSSAFSTPSALLLLPLLHPTSIYSFPVKLWQNGEDASIPSSTCFKGIEIALFHLTAYLN